MRYLTACDSRNTFTSEQLMEQRGNLDFQAFGNILRSHPSDWNPWTQDTTPICQHSSHQRRDSTTSSQISELGDRTIHWFTGSSNPCLSVYWPFRLKRPMSIKDGMSVRKDILKGLTGGVEKE
ncbi:MAG: hypothetical protein P1Q69_13215 [Candidatus Thorarchaeota archaeon]|nr:hypothetical protein [Candidatus Thorarchaeota archaeon]